MEVKINREIRNYTESMFFGLSMRQCVCSLLAVVVAIVTDWVVQTAAGQLGVDFGGFFFFGLLVTAWLVLNECISILENISQLGVPLPSFLAALLQKLKSTAEDKGEELLK